MPNYDNGANLAFNDILIWNGNFAAWGISSIVWGTEGIYGSTPPTSGYTGYIVVSANESQRIEEIDIEQGAGFEAIVMLLNKGLDVEIEVIDDSSIAPPTIASAVTLVTPFGTANMLMVGSKASQARKREGMKTLTFKSFNAIAGLH